MLVVSSIPSICFNLLFFFTLISTSFPTKVVVVGRSDVDDNISEVLRSHGLPMGLLPKGVIEFSFDENGRFEAHREQPCNAKFENVVRYERNISGTISYGQIQSLSGFSAQELFLWFPVKGIRVDIPSSGLIYFDVGVIYKQFSLSLFETPPDCKIDDGVAPDLRQGNVIAENVIKSLSGKLRYELDQEYHQRAIM